MPCCQSSLGIPEMLTMRDHDRIRPFLEKLQAKWLQCADLWFKQLVENLDSMFSKGQIVVREDGAWERAIEAFDVRPGRASRTAPHRFRSTTVRW